VSLWVCRSPVLTIFSTSPGEDYSHVDNLQGFQPPAETYAIKSVPVHDLNEKTRKCLLKDVPNTNEFSRASLMVQIKPIFPIEGRIERLKLRPWTGIIADATVKEIME
jgi:hypothetical protein